MPHPTTSRTTRTGTLLRLVDPDETTPGPQPVPDNVVDLFSRRLEEASL